MRYVGLKEFLSLPPGTVYEPARKDATGHGQLYVKGDIVGDNDWYYLPLSGTLALMSDTHSDGMAGAFHLWKSPENSAPLYTDVWGREGTYPEEGEVFFYIYEVADILKIITMLSGALVLQDADLRFSPEEEELSKMQMAPEVIPTEQAMNLAAQLVRSSDARVMPIPQFLYFSKLALPTGIPITKPAENNCLSGMTGSADRAEGTIQLDLIRRKSESAGSSSDLRKFVRAFETAVDESPNDVKTRCGGISLVVQEFETALWGKISVSVTQSGIEFSSTTQAEIESLIEEENDPATQLNKILGELYEGYTETSMVRLATKDTTIHLFQDRDPFGTSLSYGFVIDEERLQYEELPDAIAALREIVG